MTEASQVVLLVELPGGEIVAVPFISAERAELWEARHYYEVAGRPRIVSARALSVAQRMRDRAHG